MINIPTSAEKSAMRSRYMASKPKKAVPVYQVWQCGLVIFGPASYPLCRWFINTHGLKTTPKEKK